MKDHATKLIFVYGTLRKHERNHRLLEGSVPVALQCWTEGMLYDSGFGYPAMVQEKSGRVYGELYEVTAETLKGLDALEGYTGIDGQNYYDRVVQQVYTNHSSMEALMYVMAPEKVKHKRHIQTGDWRFEWMTNGLRPPEFITIFKMWSAAVY